MPQDSPDTASDRDAWNEASQAVQVRSAGRTREQVAEDLRQESALRGLKVSDQEVRWRADAIVSLLEGRPITVSGGPVWSLSAWRTFRLVRRILKEAAQEGQDELPSDFRPPAGKWLRGRVMRAVRLDDTAARQEVLGRVVRVFDEDDDESVAAWSWLDVRADDSGAERIAVVVGTHLIGFLPREDGQALAALVQRSLKRREVVWVDTFIEREDGVFVADVNLP